MNQSNEKLLAIGTYLKVWGVVVVLVTLSYGIFLLQIEPLWLRRFLFTAIALIQATLSVTYFMQMRSERSSLAYAIILPVSLLLALVVFALGEGGYVHGVRYAFFGQQTAIVGQEKTPPQNETPAVEAEDHTERGKELAQANGCLSCHTINGSRSVGPTWKALYGMKVELEDGTTVIADDAYLRESIMAPKAKIVKGFPNIMPPIYGEQLSAQQIDDLIAYIKSLGEEAPHQDDGHH